MPTPHGTNGQTLQDSFCHNARTLRTKRQLTQLELAKRMDVARSYVADLERGRNSPTLIVIANLAKALNVAPAQLLRIPREKTEKKTEKS